MEEYNFLSFEVFRKMIIEKMSDEGGYFLNRISGSDYNAVFDYYINNDKCYESHMENVSNYNGYFDKETDLVKRKINFLEYLKSLLIAYKNSSSIMTACNEIKRNLIEPQRNIFNKYICRKKPLIDYLYVESVYPFLEDFKIFAKEKKILVISPFSDTIQYQFKHKDYLINNYIYPDFILLTYDTPVTYNDKYDKLSFINTDNWLEQSKLMTKEISEIDFDIALLSCASYSEYLGNFINLDMGKKAIYIGGIMNILFNIKGGRYTESQFYKNINNQEYAISAFEKTKYENIKGGRGYKTEAFNAYF